MTGGILYAYTPIGSILGEGLLQYDVQVKMQVDEHLYVIQYSGI